MKLEFEGDHGEVDTILGTMRDAIVTCDIKILECMDQNRIQYMEWWQDHKKYLTSIMDKIKVSGE